jgi:hypothetical protein
MTAQILPASFHTQAWNAIHNGHGDLIPESTIVAIIANLLEQVEELKAQAEQS